MRNGLTFLHGAEFPRCTATVDKRFVGYSSLQFAAVGGVHLHYNSQKHQLNQPAAWTCNPGPQIHFSPLHRHWHHYYVAVTGPLLDEWRADGLWPQQPTLLSDPITHKKAWQQLHQHLADYAAEGNPWHQQRAINQLEYILLMLLPSEAQSPEAAWLQAAKRDLANGYKQQICARNQGMAVSTFRRHFTEAVGICPQDWLHQQRIDQARDLLLHSDTPIASIAAQLDYADAPHFARQFKQRVGISPRDYRGSRHNN